MTLEKEISEESVRPCNADNEHNDIWTYTPKFNWQEKELPQKQKKSKEQNQHILYAKKREKYNYKKKGG